MSLKHVHTRDRADGLKETVLEVPAAEVHDKLQRLHKACGEIFGGPIEAIIVITKLLDIYKEITQVHTALITEHRAQ